MGTAHPTLVVADLAPLCPPYIWIPACAGMTGQVQQDAAGGLGVSHFELPGIPLWQSGSEDETRIRRVQGLVPAGVWGVPRSLFSSPKNGGSRGLKASPEAMLVKPCGIGGGEHRRSYDWIPAPRLHEDKLRGNDNNMRTQAQKPVFAGSHRFGGESVTRPGANPRRVCRGALPLCREYEGVRRPCAVVIARSEATKQSRGGVMWSDERVDCRAFSSLGLENGSQ